MKKLSLQWRITLMTALLICSTCMAMNWLIGCSGRHYMDSIGANLSTAIDPSEGAVEYFDPSREGLDPNLTIVIYGAQNSFTATNWYITAAVTLLGGILAYFVSGRALRPLRTFVAQVEKVQPNNLADMKITEEVLPEFRQFSDSFNQMLERLDEGFTAQRQFTGNAAHELRTPLALILGWAEQLEQDTALPAAARQKACGIRTQSEKLRTLIEDLNLTSKLQYGAQPLRCRPTQAGPLLRRLAAEFCDSPLAACCTVALEIAPDADKAILDADAALLARAVENLLHNAACHNPGPVQVQLSAVRTGKTLRITIADDGAGYPPAVLHALQTGEAGENTPHILGLHVVEQIIRAHGGTAAFARNAPRGAKAVLVLPVTEDPAAR